jgi:hypothetical protein
MGMTSSVSSRQSHTSRCSGKNLNFLTIALDTEPELSQRLKTKERLAAYWVVSCMWQSVIAVVCALAVVVAATDVGAVGVGILDPGVVASKLAIVVCAPGIKQTLTFHQL